MPSTAYERTFWSVNRVMSSDGKQQTADWSYQKLNALRRALEQGKTPAGFEQLRDQMQQETMTVGHRLDDGEEAVMLAHLISAAIDGVDIPRRYPQAFQRLLADPYLRAAFLDALEILDDEPSLDLPLPASRDVSFLQALNRDPAPERTRESSAWQVRWRRSAEEIAGLFSFLSQSPLPALREAAGFLEDETVTLLRGKVSAVGLELDVTVEATRPAAQPDELQLSLWVLSAAEPPATQSAVQAARHGEEAELLATVTWGAYEAQVTIAGDGHYPLPSRPISSVLDDADRSAGDLSVTIQQKH